MASLPGLCGIFLLLAFLSDELRPTLCLAATLVSLRSDTVFEGVNVTVSCDVSDPSGPITDSQAACGRVRFTRNLTIIAEDTRHQRSGVTRDPITNEINCSLSILRVRTNDSGRYGCCWAATDTGLCAGHPTAPLLVQPLPTTTGPSSTSPTLTPTSTSASTTTTRITKSTKQTLKYVSQEVEYNAIPSSSSNNSGGTQDARTQTSIHKTVWPILLVVAILVIVFVVIVKHIKRRPNEAESPPDRDPEAAECSLNYSGQGAAQHNEGMVTTTTTTTTMTTLHGQNNDDDFMR